MVARQLRGVRPVGQVHRAAAGEAAPDLLGDQRQQRRAGAGDDLEAGVERVERLRGRLAVGPAGVPEALPRAADVPVRQHVQEAAHGLAGGRDVIRVHLLLHRLHELPQLGQQVAVEQVRGAGGPARLVAAPAVEGVGVEREEVPRVPQRDEDLADPVADALLGDDEVAAAQDRAGHQEPAHRVGAVPVEHLRHVGVVAQRLAHLGAVGAEHDAVGHAGGERRSVEQRRRQYVQRVEPAARLPDVLDDEVAREVVLEPLGVLEGVVHLGEAHRPGVEPHVEDVLDPAHRAAARGVVGVGPGQLVHEGTVQVGLALVVARDAPEVALDLLEGPVDVDARVLRVVGAPHGNGAAPEAVTRDRPVAGVLQPLAELTVLDVLGGPRDLLVELEHAVLELRDLDEPARHALVDQGLPAAPAVRVGVVVGLAAHEDGALGDRAGLALAARRGLEVVDDVRVGVEDEHPGVVDDGVGELAVGADGHDGLDALAVGDDLVVLAERAGGVHEPRAVGGRDELRLDDAEGVVVPEVVGERRLVAVPGELGPLEPLDDQRRDVSLGVAGQLPGV